MAKRFERHEVELKGCSPNPLASYLKSLGILRLVSDQSDCSAAGRWEGNVFILRSNLTRNELLGFFLNSYAPTPIISPWNGRAGFLEGEDAPDSTRKGPITVKEVNKSIGRRFAGYRSILNEVRNIQVLSELNEVRARAKKLENCEKGLKKQNLTLPAGKTRELKELKAKEGRLKNQLLLSLRAEMTDQFLPWIDACFVLANGDSRSAPLLGSGGNEGSMDFSINHLGHLTELIDPSNDQPTSLAVSAIDQSLFGDPSIISRHGNPGFLNPGVTGGPNMGTGFERKETLDNPWNTVLMMEGVVLFAAAVTKRIGPAYGSLASFPFIFETLRAGHGSVGSKEKSKSEFWAPIWRAFASVGELQTLLAEGRATVGRRAARNGLDMVKSVNSLGVDRGLQAFERYGFFERRGKGYSVATPMGRFQVGHNTATRLVDELENWLSAFRKFESGQNVGKRFVDLRRTLEERLFTLANHRESPANVQRVLALLGEIQLSMGRNERSRGKVAPVPLLSERWTQAADDHSPAFRVALSLAGLRGLQDQPLPIRSQLFPIHHSNGNEWLEKVLRGKGTQHKNDPACRVRLHISRQRNLESMLIALLQTRLSLPARLDFTDKPMNSSVGTDLADLMLFLSKDEMDTRVLSLLLGLSLCKVSEIQDQRAGRGDIHAAYALCKLAVVPDATLRQLGVLKDGEHVPVASLMVPKLASGNPKQAKDAVRIAWKRLQSSNLDPIMPSNQLPELAGIDSRRLAAALLVPLNYGATRALATAVLRSEQDALGEAL